MDPTQLGSSPNFDAGAAALMSTLLGSLLDDFDSGFRRGEELLTTCPDTVLSTQEREQLALRLREAKRAVAATRALVAASTQPMAVSMDAMRPWHHLVTEVWQLSARLRREKP